MIRDVEKGWDSLKAFDPSKHYLTDSLRLVDKNNKLEKIKFIAFKILSFIPFISLIPFESLNREKVMRSIRNLVDNQCCVEGEIKEIVTPKLHQSNLTQATNNIKALMEKFTKENYPNRLLDIVNKHKNRINERLDQIKLIN